MKKPTDEWLVLGIDRRGIRRRFVFHHDQADSFLNIASHATGTAIRAWGGDWHKAGNNITILSITNQEAQEAEIERVLTPSPVKALA